LEKIEEKEKPSLTSESDLFKDGVKLNKNYLKRTSIN